MPDRFDTTDRTIRNQRYRGWPAWVWILGWILVWLPVMVMLEVLVPYDWRMPILIASGLSIVGSFIAIVVHLDVRPVERLKLGDELRVFPVGRLRPEDIRTVRFQPDDLEDFVEGRIPVRQCGVIVEVRRRKLRLVVSAGDAVRLREWAERMGVAVDDPGGHSVCGGDDVGQVTRAAAGHSSADG